MSSRRSAPLRRSIRIGYMPAGAAMIRRSSEKHHDGDHVFNRDGIFHD
jgi:hypothetical protein